MSWSARDIIEDVVDAGLKKPGWDCSDAANEILVRLDNAGYVLANPHETHDFVGGWYSVRFPHIVSTRPGDEYPDIHDWLPLFRQVGPDKPPSRIAKFETECAGPEEGET